MGTRNRAFEIEGDEETRNGVHEISTISKQSHTDGPQLSKFVSDFLSDLGHCLFKICLQAEKISGLDINSFATRKTLAQGLLDLALLTANAAQLRRVMLQGNEFRFYYLLVTLITISICLQVACTFPNFLLHMQPSQDFILKGVNETFFLGRSSHHNVHISDCL